MALAAGLPRSPAASSCPLHCCCPCCSAFGCIPCCCCCLHACPQLVPNYCPGDSARCPGTSCCPLPVILGLAVPWLVCDLLSGWLVHQRSSPSPAILALRAVCRALGAGGVYASADAARVGGGLYQALVEALCTLATDPSPRVAAAGLAALRSAAVELVPVPAAAAAAGLAGSRATLPAPSRTPLVTGGGSSGALPVGTPAASGAPGAFLAGSR